MSPNNFAMFVVAKVLVDRQLMTHLSDPTFPLDAQNPHHGQKYSLVVIDKAGRESAFAEFVAQEGPTQTVVASNLTPADMDPRLSGFAGAVQLALQIKSEKTTRTFNFGFQTSRSNAMNGPDLLALIQFQEKSLAEKMLTTTLETLNSNLKLNAKPEIKAVDLQVYLNAPANEGFVDSLMNSFLTEIQVDALGEKKDLKISTTLQTKLLRGLEQRPTQVEIKFDQVIRGPDIVELIDAQKDHEKIYKDFDQALRPIAEDKGVAIPVNWPQFLNSLTDEEATQTFPFVAGVLNGCFGLIGYDITIPERLRPAMAPAPIQFNNKRDELRFNMGSNQWASDSNREYWQRIVMVEIDQKINPVPLETTKNKFADALIRAEDFAKKIQPSLAARLSESRTALSSGKVDDPLITTFEKNIEKQRILNAVAICEELFGGTGSWNDLMPETEDQQNIYLAISGDLQRACTDLFCAAISN